MAGSHRNTAFTLIEALLAVMILAVAMTGLLTTVQAGWAQTSEQKHALRAGHLAGDMIERLLAIPYDQLPAMHGFNEDIGELKDAGGQLLDPSYQHYARQVTCVPHTLHVAALNQSTPGTLVEVLVTDANDREWRLTRFIAEPSP